MTQHVLLLVGSARASGTSTSEALGSYLLARLAARGATTSTRFVSRSARGPRIRTLLDDVDAADLMVLATPLYVDALPSLVTAALEAIARHRTRQDQPRPLRLVALLNCGFPEASQCDTALGICRSFARHAYVGWAGGMALGAGEVIAGRPLESLGRLARHPRAALDRAADALADGRGIPVAATELMARRLLPRRMYTSIATLSFLRTAHRHGALGKLAHRPFALPTEHPISPT
jgi:hypothetical protein